MAIHRFELEPQSLGMADEAGEGSVFEAESVEFLAATVGACRKGRAMMLPVRVGAGRCTARSSGEVRERGLSALSAEFPQFCGERVLGFRARLWTACHVDDCCTVSTYGAGFDELMSSRSIPMETIPWCRSVRTIRFSIQPDHAL